MGLRATLALAWRFGLVLLAAAALLQVLNLDPAELRPLSLTAPLRRPDALAARPEPAVRPDATYPSIQAHPLFYPSRTRWAPPPAPVEEPPPPAPSPLNDYTLIGVILSGASRSAIIRLSRENRSFVLSEGQELEGWTLREITRERASFVSGDAAYEMTLLKPSEAQR